MPYGVRFRQCLIEYRSPTNESRRPLYNALKYATSFPVIYLSAAQRIVVSELATAKGGSAAAESWHGEHALFRLWLLAAAINSLYSFWWDVTHDWGFDLLLPRSFASGSIHSDLHRKSSPPRPLMLPRLHSRTALLSGEQVVSPTSNTDLSEDTYLDLADKPHSPTHLLRPTWHPFGLRPTLLFPLPVYPFAILADLVLRLTWSAKLSSHLHSYADGDLLIFCFELAEMVRRWMWVFIRVEWEVIKRRGEVRVHSPPPLGRMASIGEEEYEMVPSDRNGSLSPGR